MNRPTTPARRLRRSLPGALLVAALGATLLPGPGLAGARPAASWANGEAILIPPTDGTLTDPLPTTDEMPATATAARAATAASGPGSGAPQAASDAASVAQHPSQAYLDWLAHENDRIPFTPGERVTVGFTPRSTDIWDVGGHVPTALPAGRATGRAMAASQQGTDWVGPEPQARPGGTVEADGTTQGASGATGATGATAATAASELMTAGVATADTTAITASVVMPSAATVAPAAATGLRRQVIGFLPYWELPGASTSLNYGVLTTIAYFSVGANGAGSLLKRNSDGSLTTGWAGWTSSSLTNVINAAHAHGTRVVLTASVFAWSSGGVNTQRTLLSSSTARLNLARQLAAAVRDRGADGVNLDFEPLVSGQEANFVALLRTLRSQLNAIRSGYQITYDTTGYIGNYPLEASVGSAAADAVFIMGYDYRTASSSTSGSIDPLYGPTYDLADTVRQYTARISPSRLILGLPWYGRAWSTTSSSPRAANQSGAKYGYSTTVNYENIPALVSQYGRQWDSVEQSPYIAYRRQNCTSTYGCVTSWRQLWYDDAASISRRYQLVNDYGLRGAGMWALGYDGGYQDMARALSDAFLVDHSAPQAGIRTLPATNPDEGIVVAWSASDISAVRSYDVQASVDGGAWTAWLTGTTATSDVWLGADGHAYAFRVRATDAKGNVGAWNVTATAATAPASLAVGGFGRVTLNGLAYRTGPSTSAARLGSLPAGTIVALTSGPVAAGGYTWYEVTQPIREWAPSSFVERGVWIAARSSTETNVVPFHAPNATVVDAGLTGFGFGPDRVAGTSAAAVAARTFSPNGDGSRDELPVNWTATVALSALSLRILRTDGTLVGSVSVPVLTTGAHAFAWDGKVGGTRVADGMYLLQLVGTAGTTTYRAPSAMPVTSGQIAAFAVTVDTVAPVVSAASASSGLISPNGDRILDTIAYALRASGATSWVLRIAPVTPAGAQPVRTVTGSGGTLSFTWNGRNDAGTVVPDGTYTTTLAACDVAGNCAARTYSARVDTTRASVTATAAPAIFSPNGDGAADTASLRWASSETTSGTASVWRGTTLVRRWTVGASAGGRVTWNGRSSSGSSVTDGRYTFKLDVRDTAGNRTVASTYVTVDRTSGFLRWSRSFYPQDGDWLAPTSIISWKLTRTATTTLALFDTSGNLVRTVWTAKSQAAGTRSWAWNGRLASGTFVPQGAYVARLTVVSPYGTQVLGRTVCASAFPGSLSSSSVRPGQILTVSFATAEPLRNTPRVTFRQPGLSAVTISATKLANGRYVARFTVRAGSAGVASVRIAATDTGGHLNATVYALAISS